MARRRPLSRLELAYWRLRDRIELAIRRPLDRIARAKRLREAGLDPLAVPGPTCKHALIWWLERHGPDELHKVALAWNWDQDTLPLRYIVDRPDCDKGTALTIFFSGEPNLYAAQNRGGPYDDPRYQHLFTQELIASPDEIMPEDILWLLRRISENWAAGFYKTYRFFPGENAVFFLTKPPSHLKISPDNMPWPVPADLCDSTPQGEMLDILDYGEGYPSLLEDVFAMRPDIRP
jgi:hypothetical protein